MSRADDLRALADAVEAEERLATEYEAALEAYRVDPSDDNRAAYKAAAQAVVDARQASRAEREGSTDALATPPTLAAAVGVHTGQEG